MCGLALHTHLCGLLRSPLCDLLHEHRLDDVLHGQIGDQVLVWQSKTLQRHHHSNRLRQYRPGLRRHAARIRTSACEVK